MKDIECILMQWTSPCRHLLTYAHLVIMYIAILFLPKQRLSMSFTSFKIHFITATPLIRSVNFIHSKYFPVCDWFKPHP